MDRDKRLEAVVCMTINATVLMMAKMSSMMMGAVGEMAVGMGEVIEGALGSEEQAKKRAESTRDDMKKKISAETLKMLTETHAGISEKITATFASLAPEELAEFHEDISDESYDRVIEAIRSTDLGLPKLYEKLSVEDLGRYLNLEDPGFDKIMGALFEVKQPRLMARMKAVESEQEPKEEAPDAPDAPEVIEELPATYKFAPGVRVELRIPSDYDFMLRWNSKLTHEQRMACDQSGMCLEQDGSSMSAMSGGMSVQAFDGVASAAFVNTENIPIVVELESEMMDESDAPEEITWLPVAYKFAPGASSKITIDSNVDLLIEWSSRLSEEKAGQCKKNGMRLTHTNVFKTDGISGKVRVKTWQNQVKAVIENLEEFPINVDIASSEYVPDEREARMREMEAREREEIEARKKAKKQG